MTTREAPSGASGPSALTRLAQLAESRPLVVFGVVFSSLWLLFDAVILSPNYGGEDIYYFKDPGINFVEHLGFVSRFTFGNPTFAYASYSQYPPVYPFLFGLYAKLFGVSVAANQLFNTLVGLAVGISGYCALEPALRAVNRRWSKWVAALVLAVCVALSFFRPEADRPDGMATAVALWALILIRTELRPSRAIAAGALCAATFFISPYVAIWTSIVAAILVIAQEKTLDRIARTGAWAVLGAVAAGAVALGLIALLLPGWLAQFAGVFTGATTHNETGGGYFVALLHGDLKGWLAGFSNIGDTRSSLITLAIAQIALLAALVWNGLAARRGDIPWAGLWITALVLVSPACIVFAPYQANYMRVTASMLLAAAAGITLLMPASTRPGYAIAILAGFLGLSLMSGPNGLREVLIRTTTGPSLKRAEAYIATHRTEFAGPGALMAAAPQSYMLWRQEGVRPLTTAYSGFKTPDDRARLTHVALSYIGSGDPSKPAMPDWPVAGEFSLSWSPSTPPRPRVLGLTLSRSSQTWESAIYSRQAK
jgi:hypothetical protein